MTGPGNYEITCMVPLPNGDVVLGGNYQVDSEGICKMFLVKLTASGSIAWQKTTDRLSRISGLQATAGNKLIISAAGSTMLFYPFLSDQPLIVTDTAVNVLWVKNLAADTTVWPFYTGLSQPFIKNENDWYFTSTTKFPIAATLFNMDSTGTDHCTTASETVSFYDTTLFTPMPVGITMWPITATVTNQTLWDTLIMAQLYADSCDYTEPNKVTRVDQEVAVLLYPNPAGNKVHLKNADAIDKVVFYDITGKLVDTQFPDPAHDIDVRSLGNGCYILRLYAKDQHTAYPVYRKLLVMH